jgi:hypothetical protein
MTKRGLEPVLALVLRPPPLFPMQDSPARLPATWSSAWNRRIENSATLPEHQSRRGLSPRRLQMPRRFFQNGSPQQFYQPQATCATAASRQLCDTNSTKMRRFGCVERPPDGTGAGDFERGFSISNSATGDAPERANAPAPSGDSPGEQVEPKLQAQSDARRLMRDSGRQAVSPVRCHRIRFLLGWLALGPPRQFRPEAMPDEPVKNQTWRRHAAQPLPRCRRRLRPQPSR